MYFSKFLPLKRQTTSLLAPYITNPFAFLGRIALSGISSLLLKLNELTEMHFCLVKLRSDKKPSYKIALGKTLIAYSNLTCASTEYTFLDNIKWWFSVLLLINSFWLERRNHKKTWNYNGAIETLFSRNWIPISRECKRQLCKIVQIPCNHSKQHTDRTETQ